MQDNNIINNTETLFRISPEPDYEHLMKICDLATSLGLKLLTTEKQFSFEEVQEKLYQHGPSFFLNSTRFQEDISPKAPPQKLSRN